MIQSINIKFLGGAGSVTGSKYLLEADDFKLLLDCGLFQGSKNLRLRNWDDFPVNPSTIDTVVVSHAHIDHTGYLPRLFRQGFEGPVHCTRATADLMHIMLLDAAKLQEEEAEWARKKGYSKHKKPQPLFNTEDAERVFPWLRGVSYRHKVTITENITAIFHDAGHILGSAIVELRFTTIDGEKKLVFSGDIGRYNHPVLFPPTSMAEADILMVESTYGGRNNPPVDTEEELANAINGAFQAGGCVLIPAFAVGRTQTLIYLLHKLIVNGHIPSVPIYVDSPMAISVTKLYKKYHKWHKLRDCDLEDPTHPIFDFENVHYIKAQKESALLNEVKSEAIIISASGMATGGRILHHMFHRLPRPNDTFLIVGYQPEGTRGRQLLDGHTSVKIFGEEIEVRCRVVEISGLSAHADKSELLQWLSHFQQAPKRCFIVHGEEQNAQALQNELAERWNGNVFIPQYLESFELFQFKSE
jgi:metallo-beta-lactamase family protein